MLFCDPTPISSKDVEEIKPENWSNEDTGKVLAWTKAQLNGKKWKSATYNYKVILANIRIHDDVNPQTHLL